MLELLTNPETWIALATLTLLEIVLGIDNLVFIAILTDRLPRAERPLAYRLGLGGAMFTRIGLLLSLSWVMRLTDPLFTIFGNAFSGRDLIVLSGGLFLIAKSVHEIYEKVELVEEEEVEGEARKGATMTSIILQITVMDIIFSLDSVVTAVGMVSEVAVMIAAIIVAVIIMIIFARAVGDFVNEHPSMKLLALSFMMLIGVLLVAEGFDQHLPKGYVYAAMGFALFVELLNMRFRKRHREVVAKPADATSEESSERELE
ncbi:MAG: TerC family protein [Sandaracinaceae bacterium]|nr:TerC family protein [Sandaracinaceae bacterium]